MRNYDIETIEELVESLNTLNDKEPEIFQWNTVKEIIDDAITTGAMDPKLVFILDLLDFLEKVGEK